MNIVVVLGLISIAAYFLFWPVPIDPVAWNPKPSPGFAGPFAENRALKQSERIADGLVTGPESVALGPDGFLFTGLRDGRIVRIPRDGSRVETLVNTGGSPGGMEFDAKGNLWCVDADLGLLRVTPDGAITVQVDRIDGKPMLFVDDLTIASDGTIWFTDGSQRFPEHHDAFEFLEGRATGRLITYDPNTGETLVRLTGLRFANGVAFGPNESYVLVNESLGYQTRRLWLKGPRAGTNDVFLENLPALPDNVTFNGKDLFWVALVYPRDAAMDWMTRQRAWLKKVVARIPSPLLDFVGRPPARGMVLGVDLDGNIVHNLQDPTGHFRNISSVIESEGSLFLGSIRERAIGRIDVPRSKTRALHTSGVSK